MEELSSIVVVTQDNLDYARDCLRSVGQYTPEPHELILVDNASNDGTAAWLRSVPGAQVIVQESATSYAACVNRAMADAIGDYIVILDSASYVTEGWLGRLIAGLRAEPGLGAVGPLTNVSLVNPVQNLDVPYHDLHGVAAFGAEIARSRAGSGEVVPNLDLFCWMMTQEAMERVGPLDETLTIFLSQDYSLRMRLSKMRLRLVQDVFVHRSYVTTWTEEELEADNLRFRHKWEKVKSDLTSRATELATGEG